MKKVLMVSYYLPPVGMSGVMRVTKLAKYLPRFDWQPYTLTTKRIAYYHYDYELLNDLKDISIYRSESLDLARLSYLLKIPTPAVKAVAGKLSLLSNFLLFPDAKIGWYPFAYRLGCKIVEKEKPDIIWTTAPPFSTLLIGRALKKRYGIPLISDFRDPWPTGFVEPPGFIRNKIKRLREAIIKASDRVIAVNRETAESIDYPQAVIIENGFDPDEFKITPRSFQGFNIVHTGNIWEIFDDLKLVIDAVSDIPSVRFTLVGNCDANTLYKIKHYKNVRFLGVLSHAETIAIMKGASLLLYLSKPNQAVGIKLYEYFGAEKPILGISRDCNPAMRMIENHEVGLAVPPQKEEVKQAILSVQHNKFPFSPIGLDHYNRINQAKHLSEIFNELVGQE